MSQEIHLYGSCDEQFTMSFSKRRERVQLQCQTLHWEWFQLWVDSGSIGQGGQSLQTGLSPDSCWGHETWCSAMLFQCHRFEHSQWGFIILKTLLDPAQPVPYSETDRAPDECQLRLVVRCIPFICCVSDWKEQAFLTQLLVRGRLYLEYSCWTISTGDTPLSYIKHRTAGMPRDLLTHKHHFHRLRDAGR